MTWRTSLPASSKTSKSTRTGPLGRSRALSAPGPHHEPGNPRARCTRRYGGMPVPSTAVSASTPAAAWALRKRLSSVPFQRLDIGANGGFHKLDDRNALIVRGVSGALGNFGIQGKGGSARSTHLGLGFRQRGGQWVAEKRVAGAKAG